MIKKQLHDKLIDGFEGLEYTDEEGGTVFEDVKKIYIDYPTSYPSCEIMASDPVVTVQGIDYDTRSIGFSSIVSDLIEENSTEAEAERKIDRLSDIEDIILDYLEQIPNIAEGFVAGQKVMRIDITGVRYNYEQANNGLRIYQVIDFGLVILVGTKSLGQ